LPRQRAAAIVHGDLRIDNNLVDTALRGATGRGDGPVPSRICVVRAVVDWELASIGDPVADVATMCAYRDVAFDHIVGVLGAWVSPRLRGPFDLAMAYARCRRR